MKLSKILLIAFLLSLVCFSSVNKAEDEFDGKLAITLLRLYNLLEYSRNFRAD